MQELTFTTVDRVFAKLNRSIKDTQYNETDIIEMIGEAMDFMKVYGSQEQAIYFAEVKNHEVYVPPGFQMVLQIAKNNNFSKADSACYCPTPTEDEEETNAPTLKEAFNLCYSVNEANDAGYPVPLDQHGRPLTDYDVAYYRPYFDLAWEFDPWKRSAFYQSRFTPVRLANNTLFNTLVAKEKGFTDLYRNCQDEYTIVGLMQGKKKFRFSFESGQVAIAYLKTAIDRKTGYPLVPDQISYITAATYYVQWKLAEAMAWENRDGAAGLAQDYERKWLKYCKQAKNFTKMPKSLDQYQNLLEGTHRLIPTNRQYYKFFGDLGQFKERQFNTNYRMNGGF